MRNKSVDRFKEQKDMDRKLGILADTSRGEKKVMQGYFEKKYNDKVEAIRLNKDTERGMNLHQFTGAVYRDGALNITKKGISQIEGRYTDPKKKQHKNQKKSYEDIMAGREVNPEFMTGKRFRKKRGNVGKKFKKGKKGGKKK